MWPGDNFPAPIPTDLDHWHFRSEANGTVFRFWDDRTWGFSRYYRE